MELEAVVYSQDPFAYGCMDSYSVAGGGAWDYDFEWQDKTFHGILENNSIEQQGLHANWDSPSPPLMQQEKEWDRRNLSSPGTCNGDQSIQGILFPSIMEPAPVTATNRRKRRRTKSSKNKEEIENQRMTHIAVERNRRKQMNEYLAVLRSLMPPSYVQRGDQASIIGGAINFVKELEHLLQSMGTNKKNKQQPDVNGFSSRPFADFFTFPQISTRATQPSAMEGESVAGQNQWAVGEIEVTMVESHANLKILSKKRPRQLLKLVVGLQNLRLSVLHLNVITDDQMVLYSVSVKVEEGCHLSTVDEIAAAVNHMLYRVEEATAFS
ncbi:hypothetical protein OIU78_012158 [Salix suchowensis]|nr:transcription factor bHLH [Salix suchowensis]KAJ6335468.1 hypothetical protein OIU78_012158 [Salix suchowensis]